MNNKCTYVEPDYVLPGWGWCKCHVYNGAWRQFCKECKHSVCITLPADKVTESTRMAAQAQGLTAPREGSR